MIVPNKEKILKSILAHKKALHWAKETRFEVYLIIIYYFICMKPQYKENKSS